MLDRSLVDVYTARNATDAHLIRIQLEAAGIHAIVDGEHLQGLFGVLGTLGPATLPRVRVPATHARMARDIIASLKAGRDADRSDAGDNERDDPSADRPSADRDEHDDPNADRSDAGGDEPDDPNADRPDAGDGVPDDPDGGAPRPC